jgi:hypothetical protein
MNGQTHWILHQFSGRIQGSPITGSCDLLSPASGIEVASIQSHPLIGARFLAPSFPPVANEPLTPPETFARGGDLVAIYAATDSFPFRTQSCWRLNSHPAISEDQRVLASCELVASTQTDLLDSRPDITVSSTVPVQRVLRLAGDSNADFQELELGAANQQFTQAEGPGCLLYRLASVPFSYAEMVYPLDFESSSLDLRTSGNQRVATSVHHLFSHRLEKGVVLRSRILGLWMHSESDLETTAAHYRLFANSAPPLTA